MAGLFLLARSGGFEPPTAWFVARYSIQLSYERVSDLCGPRPFKGAALYPYREGLFKP